MAYREVIPPTRLRSEVACLWWSTGRPGRVLPDGCVDLVWTGRQLVVAGPATRAAFPDVEQTAVKLGVRLRIGAAGGLLGLPARELRDQAPLLGDVLPRGPQLEQQVAEAADAVHRMRALVDAVDHLRCGRVPGDALVWVAARRLECGVAVSVLCGELGISERQLRRRFDLAVGYSPKTLARILRLQRFLRASEREHGLAASAAEAGYADQSHLTRDCSELTGLTPGRLLASGARAAGDPLIAA